MAPVSAITCLMNEWPDPRAHRRAAVLADDLGDGLRADQVVHDRLARVLGQDARGDDRGGGRARHRLGLVVDEEHPVGVAVEGEPDVGADLEHLGLEVARGSRAGSGRPGGSGTCRRARRTASSSSNGSPANTAGTTSPPMPLAVSATTFERPKRVEVDERVDVVRRSRRAGRGSIRAGRARTAPLEPAPRRPWP